VVVVVVRAPDFCTIEACVVPTPPELAVLAVALGLRRPVGEKPEIVDGERVVAADGLD
jgi:hypothetical protein